MTEGTVTCPSGHLNSEDQHFCGDCGAPLTSERAEPEPRPGPRPLSEADRSAILDHDLVMRTGQSGAHVEARSATEGVVVYGKPVNHVLHLLLTVFTGGLWLPVWLLLAASGGQRRTTVSVDPYGNVSATNPAAAAMKDWQWTLIAVYIALVFCAIFAFVTGILPAIFGR